MIVRYGPPSKMDSATYMTLCKVTNSSETVEIYAQLSHDEEVPNWTLLDTFSNTDSDEYINSAIHKKLLGNE